MVYGVVYHIYFLLDEVKILDFKCKVNKINPNSRHRWLKSTQVSKILCIFAAK